MNEEIREILNDKDFNMIKDYIDNLQQENQQLKDRINKAIEYIERFSDPSIGAIKEKLKGSDKNV